MERQTRTLSQLEEIRSAGPVHGLFKVSDDDYHAFQAISSTALKAAAVSMADFSEIYFPDETMPATRRPDYFAFGTAFHNYMLDRGEYHRSFVSKPADVDLRTKAGKEWKAENAGKSILSEMDQYNLMRMAHNVYTSSYWKQFTSSLHETELAAFWIDEQTGLQCKAKFDLINWEHGLLDLKTTSKTIDDRGIYYAIKNYKYHIQQAHYAAGLRANLFDCNDGFSFGFVQKNQSYSTRCARLSREAAEQASTEYEAIMSDVAYGIEHNKFPGPGANDTLEVNIYE